MMYKDRLPYKLGWKWAEDNPLATVLQCLDSCPYPFGEDRELYYQGFLEERGIEGE